jgi:hypothetical protein
MEATKDHISLETAKLLEDNREYQHKDLVFKSVGLAGSKLADRFILCTNSAVCNDYITHPAYTWQEVLFDAKLFFGGEFMIISEKLLRFLQQQKYNEADLYFRKNCILINN